ncbi:PQQ-binding-like beta-propeller repeat protein [Streptomyces lydicus]|uniref:PQQ-binding-like beta-propeller repeat protein n=1 Tax=Streptomyces lydicus TaxID=47763 RepID=UPI0034064CA3
MSRGGVRNIRFIRGTAVAAVVVSLFAGTTACGGGTRPHPQDSASSQNQQQHKAYDPATKFASNGAPLPEAVLLDVQDSTTKTIAPPHVSLLGNVAWAATSQGLLAIDPETGKTRATFKPQGQSTEYDNGIGNTRVDIVAPQVVKVSGHNLVTQSFGVTVPGKGTTPAHSAIEVVAADADAVRLTWRHVVELPKEFADSAQSSFKTAMVGAHGTTAVVSVKDGDQVGVVTIDLAAGKAVWGDPHLKPVEVAAGRVIGLRSTGSWSPESLQARAVRDGSTAWSKATESGTAVAAGPGLLLVQGLKAKPFGNVTAVVPTSGKELSFKVPSGHGVPGQCQFDQQSVVVCASGDSEAFGMDPHTGKVLWALPDSSGRVAPQVTGAWHGMVYGQTEQNGPVVLDARTGKDKVTSPGAAPYWTDGRYAVTDKAIVPVRG